MCVMRPCFPDLPAYTQTHKDTRAHTGTPSHTHLHSVCTQRHKHTVFLFFMDPVNSVFV